MRANTPPAMSRSCRPSTDTAPPEPWRATLSEKLVSLRSTVALAELVLPGATKMAPPRPASLPDSVEPLKETDTSLPMLPT